MRPRARFVVTAVLFAAAALLFWRVLSRVDPAAVAHAIVSVGPGVALIPLPFAVGMTLDSLGTLALLRALGARPSLSQILPVRVACEALHLTVPAGFLAADTATALLLEHRADVPVRDGVVGSIARRWLFMRAHALYIALGLVVGFSSLQMISRHMTGGAWLPWLVAASIAMPLAASWSVSASLLGRSTFASLHAVLARIPSAALRRWLASRKGDATATDGQVARLRAATSSTLAATAAFLGCWCLEATESALILRLLGVSVPLGAVMAIEGGVSLVRSIAVVAPSGLGVVDLGYAAVLPALGADAGSAGAFLLLKRCKELIWAVIGYSLLLGVRGRSSAALANAQTLQASADP